MTTTSHPVATTHRPDAGTISGGVEFDIGQPDRPAEEPAITHPNIRGADYFH